MASSGMFWYVEYFGTILHLVPMLFFLGVFSIVWGYGHYNGVEEENQRRNNKVVSLVYKEVLS